MFSTTQLQVIQPLVESLYNDGYEYYYAHTNTNLSNSYNNYNFADITIYFGKSEFEHTSNFDISNSNVLRYDVITRNVSNNNDDDRLERITITEIPSFVKRVNNYEWVMTNCIEGQIDCLTVYDYNSQRSLNHNLDLNLFLCVPVLVSVLVVSNWLRMWFGRNGKE